MAEVAKAHMDARKINASLQVLAWFGSELQPYSHVRAGQLLLLQGCP